MADKYARYFLPALLICAAATFYFTRDWLRTVAVLLVGCPCALILATPTAMVAAMGAKYILGRIGRGPSKLKRFDPRAVAEYARCFRDPRTIHATCEDYRAAATIDLVHDKQDRSRKMRMPVLALWGKHGVINALFNCLADWREVAEDVRGKALNCGHFIAEEKPRDLLIELRRFLDVRR
jgi:haloacetate dehalogenase